jgi:hypothetical protein
MAKPGVSGPDRPEGSLVQLKMGKIKRLAWWLCFLGACALVPVSGSGELRRLAEAHHGEYHDRNFSFDLVIWDRIFGTYAACDAATLPAVPLGLDDSPFNSDDTIKGVLRDYFLTTLSVFWRALRAGGKAWLPAGLNRKRTPGATAA